MEHFIRILLRPDELKDVEQTPALCYMVVNFHPYALAHVKDQTFELCKYVLDLSMVNVKYIRNITPELEEYILENDEHYYYFSNNMPYDKKVEALKHNPIFFNELTEQPEELCWEVLYERAGAIEFIKEPTAEMLFYALEVDPCVIRFFPEQLITQEICDSVFDRKKDISLIPERFLTSEMIETTFNINNECIFYIPNASYEQWLETVAEFPYMHSHVPEKYLSKEIIDVAIASTFKTSKNNFRGCSFSSIPNRFKDYETVMIFLENNKILEVSDIPKEFHSEEVFLKVIQTNPYAIERIDNPSDFLCKTAIELEITTLLLINQTEELCWFALRKDKNAIAHIRNPTKEMMEYALGYSSEEDEIEKICKNSMLIKKFIHTRTKIFDHLVKTSPGSITDEMLLNFLLNNYHNEKIWDSVNEFMKIAPMKLRMMFYQPEHVCITAVRADHRALKYVWDQTYKVCESAVERDVTAIEFIRDPVMKHLFV